MILGATFHFEAAHRLPKYDGDCKNLHGHSYKMEVRIEGPVDPDTGMVMDLKELKSLVNKAVIEELDHSLLNNIISNPTAENIVRSSLHRIRISFTTSVSHRINLISIKLWETEGCFAEWRCDAGI